MQYKMLGVAIVAGMLFSLPAAHAAKETKSSAKKPAKPVAEKVVTVAPPSGQWEGKPPPAEGWVWRAGYYEWKDDRFQWKPGEWILDKEGMDFRQYSWVPTGDGKWKLVGGDWIPEKHASN
jgi:hypothetical protein